MTFCRSSLHIVVPLLCVASQASRLTSPVWFRLCSCANLSLEDPSVAAIYSDLMSMQGNDVLIRSLQDFLPVGTMLPKKLCFGQATQIVAAAAEAMLFAWSRIDEHGKTTWEMNPKDKVTQRRAQQLGLCCTRLCAEVEGRVWKTRTGEDDQGRASKHNGNQVMWTSNGNGQHSFQRGQGPVFELRIEFGL